IRDDLVTGVQTCALPICRNTNFRRLLLAQIVSELGDWFYSVAIYSLLLEFTGRAQSVAFAVVLQLLPQALIGPAAGVITDRFSREWKRVVEGKSVRGGVG